ncbi:hypothetical protein [uncultured Bacteroides sp.]|uniref:hypothetical protein n=1 Tax=uncultured Bacteroides sp. TaxID=162156 RepID=UPI0025936846|nr:hypothetical protein [uncultured Bacteroides sp.]
MVYDILPTTNLKYDDIRDTLNSAGGSVDNDVASAFKESAKINRWAKYKPIDYPEKLIELDELDLRNKSYGIDMPVLNAVYSDNTPSAPWSYILPKSVFRLADFRKYYKRAVPPVLFTFPDSIKMGFVENTGLYKMDVAFDDMAHGDYLQGYCIKFYDLVDLDRTNADYRVCAGLFIEREGKKTAFFLTDKKTLRQRYEDRDYGTADFNADAANAAIKADDVITIAYFLTDNDLYDGAPSLITQDNISLEYEQGVHKKTYTVEYVPITDVIETTLQMELETYYDGIDGKTHCAIKNMSFRVERLVKNVVSYFFIDIYGELAGDKRVKLLSNVKVEFPYGSDIFEKEYTSTELGEFNDFTLNYERDQFTCWIEHIDTQNGNRYNILAEQSQDIYE